MEYTRLTEGFNKAQLVPTNKNLYDFIQDQTVDWYYSTYHFNEKHKHMFDTSHSVKGIRDVTTNSLWWDIDSTDLDKAKEVTQTIVQRLLNYSIPEESIQIRFSGNKGFHIWLNTDKRYTPDEVCNIATCIAGDLPGFDTTMYDATQVLRVPLTKHPKTNLFCRPLKLEALNTLTIDEIIELSKDISSINASKLTEYYKVASIPQELDELKTVKQESIKTTSNVEEFDVKKIDFTKKPTFLDNATWALQLGYFRGSDAASKTGDIGERSNAFLYLAAVYRKKGFDKLSTYHLLKGVAESQSSRTGEEKFSNERLWETIIEQVYSQGWNGGKHRVWLEEHYIPTYGIPQIEYNVNARIVSARSGFNNFLEYAKKIDEFRFDFGIKELDDKMKARTGYVIGMLAPPGIGKCLKNGTEVMMYDGSIKKIENISVGDKLMGADSTQRKVLKKGHGKALTYSIVPIKGEAWSCIGTHVLSLKCSSHCSKVFTKGSIHNISVNEYLKLPKSVKTKLKLYRTPVEFSTKDVKYDPYIIGYWVGDGSREKPQITCGYQDSLIMEPIFKEFCDKNSLILQRFNNKTAVDFSFVTKVGKGGATSNPFLNEIRRFSANKSKLIPDDYLINNRNNRLRLLAGILDSDGHLINNTFEVITKSEQLKDNITFLSQTLGFYISCSKKYVNNVLYYRLHISGDISLIPTIHARKKASIRKQKKNVLVTGFKVEVEQINDYTGVELDGDHLYLLKDTTVTHNTSFAITAINNTSKVGKNSIVFSYDMAESVLFQKLIQRETGNNEDYIFNIIKRAVKGEEKAKYLVKQWGDLIETNYKHTNFVFKSGQTIAEIKQTTMETELALGEPIPFIVIDYSELVLSQFSDPTQASAEVIQGVREIANEMNKCVLILLQPNKMNSTPNQPLLDYNCAKGSSAIAQAVTMMITAHRPGYSSTNPENDRFFSVNCVKNRMGALFSVDFSWDGPTGKITEIASSERDFLKQLREMEKEESGSGKAYIKDF